MLKTRGRAIISLALRATEISSAVIRVEIRGLVCFGGSGQIQKSPEIADRL